MAILTLYFFEQVELVSDFQFSLFSIFDSFDD